MGTCQVLALFPGLSWAAIYKVSQRVYKFGGQPFVLDFIDRNYGKEMKDTFGQKSKVWTSAIAGSMIGVGEVFLLPFDVLKIISQTQPEALKGRGMLELLKDWRRLYKGAGWTAARNAPGSFALFGGAAWTKEVLLGLGPNDRATVLQHFFSSIVGASASILVAQPLDVIKTRIQKSSLSSNESGLSVLSKLLNNEGASALLKGVIPKLLSVGPKLVFSMTIAQSLIQMLEPLPPPQSSSKA
mmetsp:Transcript_37493/g.60741  ORF Transcript_37493/g.60741 Transcript_37493/m.60741 type:complete len:242 (-) Transcript_37493:1285-2010(-)